MTFLLRLVLPDRPGSLGAVASAIGAAGGDIQSLDVVERGAAGAVDDLLVALPSGGLADRLVTAATSVPGVTVESLRPYPAGQDIHRDLDLVDALAANPADALRLLTRGAPGVFRAGWALLADRHPADGSVRIRHTSAGGPDTRGVELGWLPLAHARRMDPTEAWIPDRWRVLDIELAAAPVGDPDLALLIGRPGGPRFLASEVLRLAHLAGIAATVAAMATRDPTPVG